MQTRTLGSHEVSAVGLGGMPLSIANRPQEERALATVLAAVDAGMTWVDTADVYCLHDGDIGHNERLIAKALRERPSERVVVATKGGLERPDGKWITNGRPEHLTWACERSLIALHVERIEVYQLHAVDDDVPLAESVGQLAELQSQGKIHHIGLSNVTIDEIELARGIAPIVSVQNRCNPMDTTSFENGVVAHCQQNGIAFLAYSPVGGHRGHARVADHRVLLDVAARRGASPYEVCLAFLLQLSPVMMPIPGASRPESAQSSARAADLVLEPEDLAVLREAFPKAAV